MQIVPLGPLLVGPNSELTFVIAARAGPKEISATEEYIVAQALLCAIRAIDMLPFEQRPVSNQTDMKRILDALVLDPVQLDFIDDGWLRA